MRSSYVVVLAICLSVYIVYRCLPSTKTQTRTPLFEVTRFNTPVISIKHTYKFDNELHNAGNLKSLNNNVPKDIKNHTDFVTQCQPNVNSNNELSSQENTCLYDSLFNMYSYKENIRQYRQILKKHKYDIGIGLLLSLIIVISTHILFSRLS